MRLSVMNPICSQIWPGQLIRGVELPVTSPVSAHNCDELFSSLSLDGGHAC